MQIRKGDIYFADLSPVVGSEQGGVRPVLVVQNDVGNPLFADDHRSGGDVAAEEGETCRLTYLFTRTAADSTGIPSYCWNS